MSRNSKKKRQTNRRKRPQSLKLDVNGVDVPLTALRKQEIERSDEEDFLFDGDEMYATVLAMHPDFEQIVLDGRSLPDELVGEDGEPWSPNLHLAIHEAVESQLANDDPKGILDVALAFEAEAKIGAHQIRHAIMNALTQQIWSMQHKKTDFDTDRYFRDIQASYREFCGE